MSSTRPDAEIEKTQKNIEKIGWKLRTELTDLIEMTRVQYTDNRSELKRTGKINTGAAYSGEELKAPKYELDKRHDKLRLLEKKLSGLSKAIKSNIEYLKSPLPPLKSRSRYKTPDPDPDYGDWEQGNMNDRTIVHGKGGHRKSRRRRRQNNNKTKRKYK